MKSHIIVDIDGTLSNCDHRVELAQTGQWDEFHKNSNADRPYNDIIELVTTLGAYGYNLIALTGRNEKFRTQTLQWFVENGVVVDELLMRPDNDFSKSEELKIRLLEEKFGGKKEVIKCVLAVIDDTDKVVVALRDYGLTVLQPRAGAY